MSFCEVFSSCFKIHGCDNSPQARSYLSGLMGKAQRKNMERIEEDVGEVHYDALHHFISKSPWDEHKVMDQIASMAEESLGNHPNSALYLDETSFVKKGNCSVGVQRQYCGRLGKTENCQVGVFAALGRSDRSALVDYRLFLPKSWAEDEARCAKAGIPEENRNHQSKGQLALEMVKQARKRGMNFQWVGGDEVYGNALPDALEDIGEVFLMDIASNAHVWIEEPIFRFENPGVGRPRTHATLSKDSPESVTVCELVKKHFDQQNQKIVIRHTTKGALEAEIWVTDVWTCDRQRRQARKRRLVVRRERDGSFKYSLTNAPKELGAQKLAYMQAQRFWIERSFQDAKSELGMADYEVRGWRGWHHHMALVSMAMMFLLRERLACADQIPLLSCRDLVELLAFYLPRQTKNKELLVKQMRKRHRQRQRDIDRHSKSQYFVPK